MPTLVLGASGNVGGMLCTLLAAAGEEIGAASRKPVEAAGPRVRHVRFDYDDPSSWDAALDGMDRVFMIPKVGDPYPDQTLVPFIDRMAAAGVERVVFLTAMALDQDWRVLKFAEDHLIGSSLVWTVIRPNWFTTVLAPGFLQNAIRAGKIALPAGEAKVSFIDARDIAAVAATALGDDRPAGRQLTLTGPKAYGWAEVAAMVSDGIGRQVVYDDVPEAGFRDGLLKAGVQPYRVEQMLQMLRAVRNGLHARVTTDVETVLGRPARTLPDFVEEHIEAWR